VVKDGSHATENKLTKVANALNDRATEISVAITKAVEAAHKTVTTATDLAEFLKISVTDLTDVTWDTYITFADGTYKLTDAGTALPESAKKALTSLVNKMNIIAAVETALPKVKESTDLSTILADTNVGTLGVKWETYITLADDGTYKLTDPLPGGAEGAKDALDGLAKKMTTRATEIAITKVADEATLDNFSTCLQAKIKILGENVTVGDYIEWKDSAYALKAAATGLPEGATLKLTKLANAATVKAITKAVEKAQEKVKITTDLAAFLTTPVTVLGVNFKFWEYIELKDSAYALKTVNGLPEDAKAALEGLANKMTNRATVISNAITAAVAEAKKKVAT
jgi:hypothetical protein